MFRNFVVGSGFDTFSFTYGGAHRNTSGYMEWESWMSGDLYHASTLHTSMIPGGAVTPQGRQAAGPTLLSSNASPELFSTFSSVLTGNKVIRRKVRFSWNACVCYRGSGRTPTGRVYYEYQIGRSVTKVLEDKVGFLN